MAHRPDGSTKKFGKDETVDAPSASTMFTTTRASVRFPSRMRPMRADVLAIRLRPRSPLFPQAKWYFQGDAPVLRSRLTLKCRGLARYERHFNHANNRATVKGRPNVGAAQPSRTSERAGQPRADHTRAALAVNIPARARRSRLRRHALSRAWIDVSKWYSETCTDAQAEPDRRPSPRKRVSCGDARPSLRRFRSSVATFSRFSTSRFRSASAATARHRATEVSRRSMATAKTRQR